MLQCCLLSKKQHIFQVMKDLKSSLLILIALLLLMSTVMMFVLFFHLYYNTPLQAIAVNQTIKKNTTPNQKISNDSLRLLYKAAISDMHNGVDTTWKNADSLTTNLDRKLREFHALRNEIKAVLKDSNADINGETDRQKMKAFHQAMDLLRYNNQDVKKENERLNLILNQLKSDISPAKQQQVINRIENPVGKKSNLAANVFQLYDLRFGAMQIKDGNERETSSAVDAARLAGSFKIESKNIDHNPVEIILVVLQPNGKTLQNSTWDSGTFKTVGGKKIYTRKLRFHYNRGEVKLLPFMLSPDEFQRGNYTLTIYHSGILIGKMDIALL